MPHLISRLWHATPEWLFRIVGAAIFLSFVGLQASKYHKSWPRLGYYYALPNGGTINLPFVQVLVDASVLSVAIGYCVRRPPRWRAAGFAQVGLPLIAAFWPLLPFWLLAVADSLRGVPSLARILAPVGMWLTNGLAVTPGIGLNAYLIGCGLILLGNALDVWAYLTLRRSFSIVAEPRELIVAGPYRWVRHPVYLGQIIAQAGVWLVLRPRPLSIAYYLAFVAMQVFRARVEDRVLAQAFGEEHARWKARTPWLF